MDLSGVDKKIREAEFFLERMREFEARMLPTGEQFDFYLTAHLSAARSVEFKLEQEHGATYGPWRRKWNWSNGPADDLLRFFAEDRSFQILESGSPREAKEPIADQPATTTVTGPPGVFSLAAAKRDYLIKIDGIPHKVTDACAEYLGVLKKMVAAFKADHP
jgi:hypothetical protein